MDKKPYTNASLVVLDIPKEDLIHTSDLFGDDEKGGSTSSDSWT